MNDKELKQFFKYLEDDDFMTIDLTPYWHMAVPAWLYIIVILPAMMVQELRLL